MFFNQPVCDVKINLVDIDANTGSFDDRVIVNTSGSTSTLGQQRDGIGDEVEGRSPDSHTSVFVLSPSVGRLLTHHPLMLGWRRQRNRPSRSAVAKVGASGSRGMSVAWKAW